MLVELMHETAFKKKRETAESCCVRVTPAQRTAVLN